MTKAELEKKSLAELHTLAADAGVKRYRMLPRGELVEKLADGDAGPTRAQSRGGGGAQSRGNGGEQRERPPRRRRRRSGAKPDSDAGRPQGSGREPRSAPERAPERRPAPEPTPDPPSPPAAAPGEAPSPRPRRRRRKRFGRRGKQGITLQDLLLPATGRQALLCAETREECTALLRGLAADLAADSKGPDPVALLIDPSPEELADWRRDAPRAEIVAAGQPRHASDALAQATARAAAGDAVILLVDSLTRLAAAYEDAEAAKEFFDSAGGNLTVVAALERPSSS